MMRSPSRFVHAYLVPAVMSRFFPIAAGVCIGVMMAGMLGDVPTWLDLLSRAGVVSMAIIALIVHRSIAR